MEKEHAVSITMVSSRDMLSNRYRSTSRYSYALQPEKIAALIQSYEQSGFWHGSIQARPHPEKPGKYEIAFGHHRIEAAKQAGIKELGLVVAKRSDADMLRMMADENRAEFKHDAMVAVESIAAVIEAYGRGEIELEDVKRGSGNDKGIFPAGKMGRDYSLLTVARFLRWTKAGGTQATAMCREAFDAYRERAATEEALNTIPSDQRSQTAVGVVVTAARAARIDAQERGLTPSKVRSAEVAAAKEAAKHVTEAGGHKARVLAVSIGKAAAKKAAEPKLKTLPAIEVYALQLVAKCEKSTGRYEDILTECRRLVPYVNDLHRSLAVRMADALLAMLKRDAEGVRNVVNALRSVDSKALVALLKE
jgi:hypothetical protein